MSYKNVIYLSHNGLGDNIFSISALRFLLFFYETVSFLHRDIYHENIKLFFNDEPRIICTPFNTNSEFDHCKEIINNNPDKDLIICGSHKNYLKTRITNEKFLNYINSHRKDNQKYDLNYDTITEQNYSFLKFFYIDSGLDLNIFYNYFYLPYNETSKYFYTTIAKYKIIFVHTKCSTNQNLNIDNIKNKYINDKNAIIISTTENLYEKHSLKYSLSEKFVLAKIMHYFDTIINASEIYIIDSCVIGLILPLVKTNKLKAKIVRIIQRDLVNTIKF